MLQAAESLVPIILLTGLGAFLSFSGFLNAEIRSGMDRFTYWIALPSLFLHSLSGTDFRQLDAGGLVLVLVLSTLIIIAAAAIIARFNRMQREFSGVFIQASFRGNLAFVGLPLIIFSLNDEAMSSEPVSEALLAIAALMPVYNVFSIFVLLPRTEKSKRAMLQQLLGQLLRNPLILSAVAGGFLGWMGWSLPVIVDRPLQLLGQTALALALVSLGGALFMLEMRGNLRLALFSSLLKVVAVPAVTWVLAVLLNLTTEQTFIAMVFSACPAASASYIMATQLKGDPGLAAAAVLISTILSMAALTIILIVF